MKREHHSALPAGTLLGEFRLESVLGQGGFGITYLAEDTALQRPVAVKEYLPVELAVRVGGSTVQPLTSGHVDTYGWGLARFLEEARTLARFRHPNIVRVIRVMEQNGTAYMVMEHEKGRSLGDAVKFRKLEGEAALRAMLVPLLDGLDHVHAAGFVHRDIKPANIMLREDGTPVLIDFGSARQSLGAETRTMTALVTEGYAPFEQYNASPDDDRQGPWTDIYSLAATLYGIVTGKPPASALVRANALLEGKPDPVTPAVVAAGGGFAPGFLVAIDRALAFRASDRPQSVAEWRELLEGDADAAAGLTVLRDAPGRVTGAAAPTAPRTAPAASGARRGLGLSVLLAVVVLAAGAGGGWYWWQGEQRARQVASLMTRADQAMADGRLFSPPGEGAAALYRAALDADPGNAEARAALDNLPGVAADLADAAIDGGDLARAETLLAEAAGLAGAGPALSASRERLAAAQTEAGRARQTAVAVAALLGRAARALASDRLTAPAGDNAAELYREALSLDADSEVARGGLAQVESRLLDRAAQDIGRDRLQDAGMALRAAAEVRGGSEAVDRLRARLAEARAAGEPALRSARLQPPPETIAVAPAASTAATATPPPSIGPLLDDAARAVEAGRLTPPADDNATAAYGRVLALDPGNAEARAGLQRVAGLLAAQAKTAIEAGELDRGGDLLDRAAGVQPDAERLPALRARLEAARSARAVATEVSALLERGDAALAALRLTSPADDNAVRHFRAVLELEPGNERAAAGLERVVERYVALADRALAADETARAEEFLERAAGVRPESELLADARARVAARREAATAATPALAPAVGPAPAVATSAGTAGEVFRDALAGGGQGPEMVVVKGARFDMGSPAGERGRDADETRHTASVPARYAVGRFEVTFDDYDRFARATGRSLPPDHAWGRGRQPVIAVSWEDAAAYAAWLSTQTGHRYRLPTEAEWEYAARGGTASAFWWGDGNAGGRASCADCGSAFDRRRPAPVGSFAANPLGVHDTAGNVWEWTCSGYDPGYNGAEQGCATQRGGSRAIRGGAYLQASSYLRSANRSHRLAHERLFSLGFRVVRDL